MNAEQHFTQWLERCRRPLLVLRNGMALVGLALLPLFLISAYFPALSASNLVAAVVAVAADPVDPVESAGKPDARHYALIAHLSQRYRIARDALEDLVGVANDTGLKLGLDPVLILSVIAVESRFNPIAESEMGAKGLMQVMPQHHKARLAAFGGIDAVLEPSTNIFVGAQILKDCIRRGGGLQAGLQLYAGAFGDPENAYAQKVMAERNRMEQVLRRSETQSSRSAAIAEVVAKRPI